MFGETFSERWLRKFCSEMFCNNQEYFLQMPNCHNKLECYPMPFPAIIFASKAGAHKRLLSNDELLSLPANIRL
jgi:hypothetical protein